MLDSMRPARTHGGTCRALQPQPCAVNGSRARQGCSRRTARCHSSLAASKWASTGTKDLLGDRTTQNIAVGKPAAPISLPAPGPLMPVINLAPETFNEFMKAAGDQIVLVDFYTDWCGPCQIMHKEMDNLTHAFPKGVLFAKFNCGLHAAFSTSQRIKSLPTFKLFQRGRCIDQVSGAQPIKVRQLLTHYYRPARATKPPIHDPIVVVKPGLPSLDGDIIVPSGPDATRTCVFESVQSI